MHHEIPTSGSGCTLRSYGFIDSFEAFTFFKASIVAVILNGSILVGISKFKDAR